MNFLKKIFGSKQQSGKEIKSDDRGKYMPELKLPIDEKFTINFKANGGKFLYCDDLNEVYSNFNNIITENSWEEKQALVIDDNLSKKFKSLNFPITKKSGTASYFLTTCENLIATDGSLLICSNQIAAKKLTDLPVNFVVYATTSQIVDTIGEGLQGIKSKNRKKIPSNITTIKHFKSDDEKDFLSYGSSSKNLYLLLLEDL
ncbi:MAG: LUD domain-containing protein [Jejuia sp.]